MHKIQQTIPSLAQRPYADVCVFEMNSETTNSIMCQFKEHVGLPRIPTLEILHTCIFTVGASSRLAAPVSCT